MADYPDNMQLFWLYGVNITIPINIESSDITLPISIEASTATIDINIASTDITLNINFYDQSAAVFGAAAWFARMGDQIFVTATANRANGTSCNIPARTVPSGVTFYIAGMSWGQTGFATPTVLWAQFIVDGDVVVSVGSVAGDCVIFDVPIQVLTGIVASLCVGYIGSGPMDLRATFWGWDEED